VRCKFFPAEIYNFFYFRVFEAPLSERLVSMPKPKILHFKGGVRHHYRTYSEADVPGSARVASSASQQ
jgi:hypothetical protein